MGVDGVLDRGLRGAEQIVLRAGREEVVLLAVQLRQAQGDGGRLLALYRYGKCWLGEARQGLLSLALDRGEAEPGDLVDQVAHGFRVGLLALAETFDDELVLRARQGHRGQDEIGRASCRESVCQYV